MSGSLALTSATTKLYYSLNPPSTLDNNATTGYPSVTTWKLIGEISNLGVYGGKTNVIKHIPIDTAVVAKRAGSVDYGNMALTIARHTGQDMTDLQTQFNSRTSTAFKVALPTALGQTDYFTAIVTGYQTNAGTADKILELTIDLELDNPVITTTP